MLLTKNEENKERQILADVVNGKPAAMKELYDCYVGFLTAVVARYIPDEDDMKDVLQNGFVKIFTTINKFQYRGAGSLKAWMTRIVVNESLDWIAANKQGRQQFDELTGINEESMISEYEEPNVDDIPMPAILEMIRHLPTGYRIVFNLYVFEGKSHREIAKLLNIKEDTSASQLHRAKAMLAYQITEYRKHLND